MSYSNCYLPQPPRAWSRVQNSCSLITDDNLVRDSYTAERLAMINKGNILQYKANSSNLTQSQKYSKIAKGQWVNRNTTWATQSTRGYTNPNTTQLKRSGNKINIAIDPVTGTIVGPTFEPLTCPSPIVPINDALPSDEGDGTGLEPEIPPPVEPSPGSDIFPDIIPETLPEPIVIQDGGTLICSIQENVCTGETNKHISQQLCNPTSDSDVPGPIKLLCWNDGTQTWYPRQRYFMTNSTNKFPINYKFLVSAVKTATPILTYETNCNSITLIWTDSNVCVPIEGYIIYLNNNTYKIVSNSIKSIQINNLTVGNNYSFYVKSFNKEILSDSSNSINVSVLNIEIINDTPGSYTYNIPKYSTCYSVIVIGAGGGGGSGAYFNSSASASGCIGGSGGGAGGYSSTTNVKITTQNTLSYTVGLGGAGGNYSLGTNGTPSSFNDGLNINISCNGGNGGLYNANVYGSGSININLGGLGGTSIGGDVNGTGGNGGDSGGIGTPTSENTGFISSKQGNISNIAQGPGGGGGGGCIYLTTTGSGGNYLDSTGNNGGNGGNGTIGGTSGQYLLPPAGNGLGIIGFGGSGGGGVGGNRYSASGINTGSGGNGIYGSGGGGGGATHTSLNPGNGGNGGNGIVIINIYQLIITYT